MNILFVLRLVSWPAWLNIVSLSLTGYFQGSQCTAFYLCMFSVCFFHKKKIKTAKKKKAQEKYIYICLVFSLSCDLVNEHNYLSGWFDGDVLFYLYTRGRITPISLS